MTMRRALAWLAWLGCFLAAAAARADEPAPAGAAVVALGEAARPHAKDLARVVYRKPGLRPSLDENVARVLAGETPAADDTRGKAIAAVIRAAAESPEEAVRRSLLAQLGRDLKVKLLVVVSPPPAEPADAPPTARVLRLPEEQFLPMTLTAELRSVPQPEPVDPELPPPATPFEWTGAVAVLTDLVAPAKPPPAEPKVPSPKPKGNPKEKKPKQKPTPAPEPAEEEEEEGGSTFDLLTSPWFWTGLGIVVSAGVTVFVLSQTALNEPDTVLVEGHIGP
jgi:hypothetical protein